MFCLVLFGQVRGKFGKFEGNLGETWAKMVIEVRVGFKGTGVRANFHWRAPMTYFMTSSFIKFMFSLICNVLVCFFQ